MTPLNPGQGELIEIVLKALYNDRANPHGRAIKVAILKPMGINISSDQYSLLKQQLLNQDLATEHDSFVAGDPGMAISQHGIEVIEKYGALSAYHKAEEKNDSKQRTMSSIKLAAMIAAIIGGIATLILAIVGVWSLL